MRDIKELNSFWHRWFYQQCVYWGFIKRNIHNFLYHFPGAYLNFIVQFVLFLASLPIFISRALQYWVDENTIIRMKIEDIAQLEDHVMRKAAIEKEIKSVDDYKSFIKGLVGFILGIATVLVTLALTKK
jgi:hypothetical protein